MAAGTLDPPSMTFLGTLTGYLSVSGVSVTTSEKAPMNAILIHPKTLTDLVTDSNGLIDLVKPVTEVPIDLKTTGAICEKLLMGGNAALSDEDVKYISRVLDQPDTSLDKKLFDISEMIRDLMVLTQEQGVSEDQLAVAVEPLTKIVADSIPTNRPTAVAYQDALAGAVPQPTPNDCAICEAEQGYGDSSAASEVPQPTRSRLNWRSISPFD